MKAICLFDEKNIDPPRYGKPSSKSTAYQIFDKDNLYPYQVDLIHHRMKSGTHHAPIAYSGRRRDLDATLSQMVHCLGTIIDMSDHYRDGAEILISDTQVAQKVYRVITSHLAAHLHAMRTDPGYELPNDDTLEELAEFGAAIYPWTLISEGDQPDAEDFVSRVRRARHYLSFDKPKEVQVDKMAEVPSVIKHLDAIQLYIEANQLR